MATQDSDEALANATIGELEPYADKVVVEDYNPEWPAWYTADEATIRAALGPAVLQVEHTGSTSVPGLPAKPIIDILLQVADSAQESLYIPALEAAGYTMRVREPSWYEHRMLRRRTEDGSAHDVNLHVFSPVHAAGEIERILAFRDWLRTHDEDRDYYGRTKRELAQREWKFVQHYANAKSEVVEEILGRALGVQ